MAEKRQTLQKEIILQTLCQMHNHPTAGMVFDQIHQTHPTISRSTVYRVLGQMADEGTILRLGLSGTDARYDGNICQHGHVMCRKCGAISDIPPVEICEPDVTHGFLIEEYAVEYRGLCPTCREAEKNG